MSDWIVCQTSASVPVNGIIMFLFEVAHKIDWAMVVSGLSFRKVVVGRFISEGGSHRPSETVWSGVSSFCGDGIISRRARITGDIFKHPTITTLLACQYSPILLCEVFWLHDAYRAARVIRNSISGCTSRRSTHICKHS